MKRVFPEKYWVSVHHTESILLAAYGNVKGKQCILTDFLSTGRWYFGSLTVAAD